LTARDAGTPLALRPFAAVVIGGSAGAIDALSQILQALPADFAPTVAVVLHLPRHRRSALPDVLARSSMLPVREPEDKEPLARGTVYVAPPDYHLLIDDGPRFALSVDEPRNFSLPSIDVLFESAARVLGPAVVGVVLTGANSDGAAGLRAICDAGGVAIAQSEAEVRSMPEAARRACKGAEMLAAVAIGQRLAALNPGGARW